MDVFKNVRRKVAKLETVLLRRTKEKGTLPLLSGC
jgi:ribosomal protein L29